MVERKTLVYDSLRSYYAKTQKYINQGWKIEYLDKLLPLDESCDMKKIPWERFFIVALKRETKQEQEMENKGKNIKPCPYCGGKGKLQNTLSIVCKIVCENCGAESMCCGSEAEAIERWNQVSTRNKVNKEIIEELKTNIASLQRLGCSGAFFDGYCSAINEIEGMLKKKKIKRLNTIK